MENERHQDSFDFAEIWRQAQCRRFADIDPWLRHFFEIAKTRVSDVRADQREASMRASPAARESA
jgi:hypothetical protein